MSVHNPDRSPLAIHSCDPAQAESGIVEIVGDDCPKPLFLAVRDRFAENRKWGIKPHQVEPAGLLSRGIVRND